MKIDWTKVKEGLTTMEVLKEENKEQKEEIERLNNIINSINDYLVMNIANAGLDFMYRQGFKDSYKRLQELKGDNENGK